MLGAHLREQLASFRVLEAIGRIVAHGEERKIPRAVLPNVLKFESGFEVSIQAQHSGHIAK